MSTDTGQLAVRAAGGVVIRGDLATEAEIVVVHRPRYDDWSLPKGKHDPGEADVDCAVREVREETGWLCRAVEHVATTRYRVTAGPKQVDYYLMRPIRLVGFVPDEEVDEVHWLAFDEAAEKLTYQFDRDVVAGMDVEAAVAQREIHVVRHGAAGDRSEWEGDDHDRPLTAAGQAQAADIAEQASELQLERILSSPYLRCVQTVQPLADRVGLPVEKVEALAEGPDPLALSKLVRDIGGTRVLLSSHGDVIPMTLEYLQEMGVRFLSDIEYRKGSTWVVGHDGTSYTEAVYLPPS